MIKEEEIRGAPDLVIEILSPATEKKDRFYKKLFTQDTELENIGLLTQEGKL